MRGVRMMKEKILPVIAILFFISLMISLIGGVALCFLLLFAENNYATTILGLIVYSCLYSLVLGAIKTIKERKKKDGI